MVETTILKKRVLNVQFSQMLFYWLYTVTWLDILDFNVISIICTHFLMTCLVFWYTMSIFSWMGRGFKLCKAKQREGGENMAADTWDLAQEQIIRTRCNLWISKDGDLMVFTLNCWSSKQHFMILTVLFLYKTRKVYTSLTKHVNTKMSTGVGYM